MHLIIGYFRLCLTAIVLSLGTLLILATSWIPLRFKGIRLVNWIVTLLARLLLPLFAIRVECPRPEVIRHHHGFIFPNHSSYLDIVVMLAIVPARFFGKEEVRAWPLVGWVAQAIGTVFVQRESKESRAQARARLAQVARYPPIVLFPEGKISLKEVPAAFRYGAFEIAVQNGIPYLPCALIFDRPEIVAWGDETLLRAIWRLASRPGPARAQVIPLEPITPRPDDDPIALSIEAHRALTELLLSRVPVGA